MNRAVFSLWRYYLRILVYGVAAIIWMPGYFLFFAPFGLLAQSSETRKRWLWHFTKHVRHFHTIRESRITLHHAPKLAEEWDFSVIQRRCDSEFEHVRQHFPDASQRRAVVYLFTTWKDIANIFGPQYGGTALMPANAIVIAYDNFSQQHIRHEFGHLFSSRWNQYAPPLLSEGLSEWLEGKQALHPIDTAARWYLEERKVSLSKLLDREFFFGMSHIHVCYALAGSFTGFLIRRHGWEQYRLLYCASNAKNFEANFAKCFGISLEEAETQWRDEVTVTDQLIRDIKKHH